MRLWQVKNLLQIRNNYHPVRDRLFRDYGKKSTNIIINIISGICCSLLLVVLFSWLFSFFFIGDKGYINIFFSCSSIILISSLILSLRSAYNFLYSGRDYNLLKALPITKKEIIISIIIFFYRNQIIVSFFFFSAAVYAILYRTFSLKPIIIGIILTLIIPLLGITLSIFITSLIHIAIKKVSIISRRKRLVFKKGTITKSLLQYEWRNLFRFSNLVLELASMVFLYISLFFLFFVSGFNLIGLILLFPALSMINVSSFSREGLYHNLLETFPIPSKTRIFAKILFYCLLQIPLLILCLFVVFLKTHEIKNLLAFIPSSFLFINTSLISILSDRKIPKIIWTNPQEVFRINFPILFLNLFLCLATSLTVFWPRIICLNSLSGFIIATILNLIVYFVLKLKAKEANQFN